MTETSLEAGSSPLQDQDSVAKLSNLEISPENLLTLANRRREILAELDQQIAEVASQIVGMIPVELSKWANQSHLANPGNIGKMIAAIGSDTDNPPYGIMSDKLKSPEDYGFSSHEDARSGMEKLQAAWKGIVDLRIGDEPNYTEVYITLVK